MIGARIGLTLPLFQRQTGAITTASGRIAELKAALAARRVALEARSPWRTRQILDRDTSRGGPDVDCASTSRGERTAYSRQLPGRKDRIARDAPCPACGIRCTTGSARWAVGGDVGRPRGAGRRRCDPLKRRGAGERMMTIQNTRRPVSQRGRPRSVVLLADVHGAVRQSRPKVNQLPPNTRLKAPRLNTTRTRA